MELIRRLFRRLFARERVVRTELHTLVGYPSWVKQELVVVKRRRL
jgi:hypothetical protein